MQTITVQLDCVNLAMRIHSCCHLGIETGEKSGYGLGHSCCHNALLFSIYAFSNLADVKHSSFSSVNKMKPRWSVLSCIVCAVKYGGRMGREESRNGNYGLMCASAVVANMNKQVQSARPWSLLHQCLYTPTGSDVIWAGTGYTHTQTPTGSDVIWAGTGYTHTQTPTGSDVIWARQDIPHTDTHRLRRDLGWDRIYSHTDTHRLRRDLGWDRIYSHTDTHRLRRDLGWDRIYSHTDTHRLRRSGLGQDISHTDTHRLRRDLG
ncbi:hypothetical protein Btru_050805 [Bulinus truncatus]|nr:hypothetical protein Btru_050805 [Bulinus truncatus]